jgi:hypothetical protein
MPTLHHFRRLGGRIYPTQYADVHIWHQGTNLWRTLATDALDDTDVTGPPYATRAEAYAALEGIAARWHGVPDPTGPARLDVADLPQPHRTVIAECIAEAWRNAEASDAHGNADVAADIAQRLADLYRLDVRADAVAGLPVKPDRCSACGHDISDYAPDLTLCAVCDPTVDVDA